MLQTLGCYGFSFAILVTFWTWIPTLMQNVILQTFILGSTCYFCCLLAGITDRLLPRRRVSPLNKAVFITGCDTGFGHLLAKRLNFKGYKVLAGCLLPEGPGAEKLKRTSSSNSNISIIGVDVTSDESIQDALKSVRKELELSDCQLWAIVNNAGILIGAELEWTPLEYYKRNFEVNTFGVVRVTQAFLPLLRKFQGRVVTTASFAGRYTFTGQVPYTMSKHAACSFCDGLRLEMEKWNVKVITVEPFAFRTPMTEEESIMQNIENTWFKATEEVKKSYGAQYIEKFKKTYCKFYKLATIKYTHRVIDCLEEAVTAYSPHYSYTPGDMKTVVGFWFLRRLPPTIQNIIATTYITFDAEMKSYLRKKIHEIKYERKMS